MFENIFKFLHVGLRITACLSTAEILTAKLISQPVILRCVVMLGTVSEWSSETCTCHMTAAHCVDTHRINSVQQQMALTHSYPIDLFTFVFINRFGFVTWFQTDDTWVMTTWGGTPQPRVLNVLSGAVFPSHLQEDGDTSCCGHVVVRPMLWLEHRRHSQLMLGLFLIVGLWSMIQGLINYSQSFLNIFLFFSFLNVLYNQCIVILNNPPCFLFPLDIKNTHCCYCTQKDRVCLASWGQGLKQGETVSLAPRLTKNPKQTELLCDGFSDPWTLSWLTWWTSYDTLVIFWSGTVIRSTFHCVHYFQLQKQWDVSGCLWTSNTLSLDHQQRVKNSWHSENWLSENKWRGQRTMRDATNMTRWRSRWCTWMEGSSKVHQ